MKAIFSFNRAPGPRWPIAVQAGVAMGAPIIMLTATGYPLVGYQAAAGSFAVYYFTQLRPHERVPRVAIIGGGLLATAALATVLSPFHELYLIGLVAVSILAATILYGVSAGLPGALFFVIIYGLTGKLVLGGEPPIAFLAALLSGTLFAIAVVTVAAFIDARGLPRSSGIRVRFSLSSAARTLLARAIIVSILGTVLGAIADPTRAYWVVASGIAVIGVVAGRRVALTRGVQRVLGTTTGAGVYLALTGLHPAGLWLAGILTSLQFMVEILIARNYAIALVAITPLVLLLTAAATGTTDALPIAVERVIDVFVGVALGTFTGVLHHRDPTPASPA